MKATRLKESKRISNGVFYELDKPIKHKGKSYKIVCTWAAKTSHSVILTFPARSGVILVTLQDGKYKIGDDFLSVDGFVKSSDLLRKIGYELA